MSNTPLQSKKTINPPHTAQYSTIRPRRSPPTQNKPSHASSAPARPSPNPERTRQTPAGSYSDPLFEYYIHSKAGVLSTNQLATGLGVRQRCQPRFPATIPGMYQLFLSVFLSLRSAWQRAAVSGHQFEFKVRMCFSFAFFAPGKRAGKWAFVVF